MTAMHDQEYLDTLEAEYLRRRRAKPAPAQVDKQRVDRSSPRWKRMRGNLGEFHGLGDDPEALDEYCDRVYRLIPRR